MLVPAEHSSFVGEHFNDEEDWLNLLLNEGAHAPMKDMPGKTWLMPGQCLHEEVFEDPKTGPNQNKGLRYMIVAAAPGFEDYENKRHLSSNVGRLLKDGLLQAGFDLEDVYFTTIARFPKPLNSSTVKMAWLKIGWQYLMEEFNRVQPDAVLFLGAESCKMAYGNRVMLDSVRGQVRDFHGVPSTAATSHLSFISNTAGYPVFVRQLKFFRNMALRKNKVFDGIEFPDGKDYDVLDSLEKIQAAVNEELLDADLKAAKGRQKWIAIDVEGGSDTGCPEDFYVTTFQWSSRSGHARIIPLYKERPEPLVQAVRTSTSESKGYSKGDPIFDDDGNPVMVSKYGGSGVDAKCADDKVDYYDGAVELIKQLLDIQDLGLATFNGRGDLMWLRDCFGIEVRRFLNPRRFRDGMLAYHLLAKDDYGLKQLTLRFTDLGAYDAPMHQYVLDNSGAGKLFPGDKKDRFFYGYRDVPYKYLLLYGLHDADATWQVNVHVHRMLDLPDNRRLKKLYAEVEIPSQHGIMDIETNGMPADVERMREMSEMYRDRYQELLEELREMVDWPDLNPNSTKQMPALLYDGPYKGWEACESVRPSSAKPLGMTPILTTGKYPKKWDDVVEKGQEAYNSPSCSDETVTTLLTTEGISQHAIDVLHKIKHLSVVKNFTKNFFRNPVFDSLSGPDRPRYGRGLIGCVDSRGRVCCEINTLSETGRWKHRRPNLANLPKRKEKEVAEVFDHAIFKSRTCFKAHDGWEIMEADYKSAELFIMGYMSGDPGFIAVLDSGVDVHGYNAVNVFKLDCAPDEVKDKYPDRRAAVKALVFGIAYGLSVTGLAERLTVELKRVVTRDDAQEIMDAFFDAYPVLKAFFDGLKTSCEVNGYVETAYGRRRYFPGVAKLGKTQLAAAKREAMNAPIQGSVADMLNVALANLDRMRYETEIGRTIKWEVMVGIHDALLVHYPVKYKTQMARILKYCMSEAVPIPGTNGRCLDVDIESGVRWGECEPVKLAA